MSPAAILLIIQGIEAAIAAAPGVIEIIGKAKDMISALFSAKLISKDVQDALHASIDAKAALAKLGIVPPHWQVEPDPA